MQKLLDLVLCQKAKAESDAGKARLGGGGGAADLGIYGARGGAASAAAPAAFYHGRALEVGRVVLIINALRHSSKLRCSFIDMVMKKLKMLLFLLLKKP